jgi:hypothetical protein
VVRNAMHPDADVFYIDEEECGHMVQFPFRLNQIFDLLFKAQNNVIMVGTKSQYRNISELLTYVGGHRR